MLVGVLAMRRLLATEPEAPVEGMHITMVPNTHDGTLVEAEGRAKRIEARLGKGRMPCPCLESCCWALSILRTCSVSVTLATRAFHSRVSSLCLSVAAVRLKDCLRDVALAVGLPPQWRQASAYTGLKLTIHVEVSESVSSVTPPCCKT
jgi:hypothetical protein